MASRAEIREERVPLLVHQILGGSAEALGELYVAFADNVFHAAHRVLSGQRENPPHQEPLTYSANGALEGSYGRPLSPRARSN